MQVITIVRHQQPPCVGGFRKIGKVIWSGHLDSAPFRLIGSGVGRFWVAALMGYSFKTRRLPKRERKEGRI